jgi:hypothetical protein
MCVMERSTYSPHPTSNLNLTSLFHCLTASLVRKRELAVASAKPQPRRSWFVLNFVNAHSAQLFFFFFIVSRISGCLCLHRTVSQVIVVGLLSHHALRSIATSGSGLRAYF